MKKKSQNQFNILIHLVCQNVCDRAWEGVLCSHELSVVGSTVAVDFE